MRVQHTFLLDNLRLRGCPNLLDYLYGREAISGRHLDYILRHKTRGSKIRELLGIIKRRSMHHFKLFLQCLRDTDQLNCQIANVLEGSSGRSWMFNHFCKLIACSHQPITFQVINRSRFLIFRLATFYHIIRKLTGTS